MPYDLTIKATPPPLGGELYPLTRFSLQTDRDTSPADGAADIIDNTTLQTFSEAGMFEKSANYYRFIVDSDGATTPNSIYPRVELRDETEYTHNLITEYRVDAQVIFQPSSVNSIIMQILDNLSGSSVSAMKVEVRGRAPLATNAWLRFKYRDTYNGTETAFNLREDIVVDGSGGFVVPPIRVRRGPSLLEVYFGANVDGVIPDWSAGDNAPISGAPTNPFSRTPAANFTYYWKSGNYLQDNSTSPALQSTIDHISGTWAAPSIVSSGALTLTPTIALRSPSQAFPEVIHFDVGVTGQDASSSVGSNGYDERLHDIEYLWDGYFVGSANAYNFSAPTGLYSGSARHSGGHTNSRYQYTPKAAFTYRVAGSYTVRVYAYEPSSGKFGFADISFTVGDQDAAYPGTQTIYADPSGNYTDPPLAGYVQTTQDNISTLISTYVVGAANPPRILLAAGESFTISSTSNLGQGNSNSYNGLRFDRRGTGANPSVTFSSAVRFLDIDDTGASSTDKEIIFANIDFNGSYDDSTTATDNSEIANFDGGTVEPEYFLLDGCTIRGVNSHVNVPAASALDERYIAFNDVDMEERAFGSLRYGGTRHTFVGFRLHSTPLAAINSSAGSGWGDRIQGRVLIYHNCDYFCRQGGNQIGAFRTPQPNIRANYDTGYTTAGDEYYFCANKFEAPGWLPNFQFIDAEGGAEKPCNVVISKNVIIGGWATDKLIQCGTGGTTIRSNVLYVPNCLNRLGNELRYFIRFEGTNINALNQSSPMKVYSNTCVNDLDGAINPFGQTAPIDLLLNNGGWTTVTQANNIVYNTRTSPAETADGPIARIADEFTITDQGYLEIGGQGDQSSTFVANTAAGELDYPELLTTSPSIGAASTGLVHDSDFFGRRTEDLLAVLTRADPSKGAFEFTGES